MKLQHFSADYLGSCANPCALEKELTISDYVIAAEGYAVACEVVSSKKTYNQLECEDYTFATLKPGDRIVGVLGERMALRGYSGHLPRHLYQGETVHLLNMGGVVGVSKSFHPDLGPPLELRVMGGVVRAKNGSLRHVCIQEYAVNPVEKLTDVAPMVIVSGTAMNSGKTHACGEIVKELSKAGFRVAAAKLTGVSLRRDVYAMEKLGAIDMITFTEAGIVSSVNKNIVPYAKGVLMAIQKKKPDVVVVELGDGVLGYYGVDDILADREIHAYTAVHVFAALDFLGAHAAVDLFIERFKDEIDVMVGPVTDNDVGRQYVQQVLGIEAINARSDGPALGAFVAARLPKPSRLNK